MSRLAILANPMSGRDVRRLAAYAATQTHEAKRSIVARVALGADRLGVRHIHVLREPFNLAEHALKHLPIQAVVEPLAIPLKHTGADTRTAVQMFCDAGCEVLVSLGGDGTNRVITQQCPDITLIPLSTGTNNVFPIFAEPTNVGMAAGLLAGGKLPKEDVAQRCKVLRLSLPDGSEDLALIDAVLIHPDQLGNLRPYDAACLKQVILTRAHPDVVGMSPIGGMLQPVAAHEDIGVCVTLDDHGDVLEVPISPGLFDRVHVKSVDTLALNEATTLTGPGIIALDGDRLYSLAAGEQATVTLKRDGPWVVDVGKALTEAAQRRLFN